MKFEEFINIVVEKVSENLKDISVCVQHFNKNNGIVLHGLMFKSDINISPTIYLEPYYKQFMKGRDLTDIVNNIIKSYHENTLHNIQDISFFTDFEKVKSKIICNLVNYDMNRELLNDVPHYKFLDLAIIFKVLFDSSVNGTATVLIHNQHLDMWNVTQDTLKNFAMQNTPQLFPYEIIPMESILSSMFEMDDYFGNDMQSVIPLYVLSNNIKLNGAICMLYKDVLKEFSNRMGNDLYILPSSIHELIVIPSDINDTTGDEFSEMVKEVNATQLARDEILSEHVYYYDRSNDRIKML